MKTPTLLISRCYSETTPESAEHGDNSDNGFVHEDEPFTFRELVDVISRDGFALDGSSDWASTGYSTSDYRTGTEREETLHFSRQNPDHLRKYFDRAFSCVERKQRERIASYNKR